MVPVGFPHHLAPPLGKVRPPLVFVAALSLTFNSCSWFTLFPPWSEAGSGDLRKGISLIGKAAKSIGGDNWGRRYVFEDGKVVVNLGYSVVVEAKAVTKSDLTKSVSVTLQRSSSTSC